MCTLLISALFFGSSSCVLGNFLAINESKRGHDKSMSAMDVVSNLNESIKIVMGEYGAAGSPRVAAIEKSIAPAFQALPKNNQGRLDPPSVRYIVHNYFAREHGWVLAGLVGHHVQVHGTSSDIHDAQVLQELAPALVESMLEDRQHGRGLSFEDAVVMIAAIERLCVQNSVALLRRAYWLNGLDVSEKVDESTLHEVLQSFLLIFRAASESDVVEKLPHSLLKKDIAVSPLGRDIVEFESDAVANAAFAKRGCANPFVTASYSFDETFEIVETLTHDYGKWSNKDCTDMKEHLMTLDSHGTGRVSIERFYEPSGTGLFQFHESEDYLRSIGALDDQGKQVLISNYVLGPTNCIANSAHYSVCCMNECEVLMNELEGKIKAPTASPEHLLRVVSNIQSTTVEAPRELPSWLSAKLREAGKRNAGIIHLHGRLFAQWLHFAFPNECPFPKEISVTALTPTQWLDGSGFASVEEQKKYLQSESFELPTPEEAMSQWSDEEVLPLMFTSDRGVLFTIVSLVMRLLPLLVLLRMAHSAWESAKRAQSSDVDTGKDIGQFI